MTLGFKFAVVCVAVGASVCSRPARGQYFANNLATLRSLSTTVNNATITLAPGDYWINGDHIANPTSSQPIFLELGGNNNTYNLTGANLKLDTRKLDGFGRALGHDSGVRVVKISGAGNTVNDLSLTGYDLDLDTDPGAQRYADWAAVYVQLTGVDNRVQGANVLSRGSSPYGLGDAFGKGARQFPQGEPPGQVPGEPEGVVGLPWVGHNKTSAFNVFEATNAVVDDMQLDVKTYGHGFFVQKSRNTTLTNSTVTGELVPSSNVINHPKYQEYGFTSHGNEIPDDIMISANEGGVRLYGSINGVPTVGFTAENVVVTNMRTGFATALGFTDLDNGLGITLNNVEAYGTETAFGLGSLTTVTNAKADIVNGPAIHIPQNHARDTTIELELVGEAPVGVDWAAAYLNGQRFNVTIDSDLPAGALPADSLVRIGQTFFNNWRDTSHPSGPEDGDPGDFIDSVFVNNTNQTAVLGNLATNNTGSSRAPVITNGKKNSYDGVSVVLSGTHVVLTDALGLGNNGAAADGSLEANASIVEAGGSLEIQPGIRVANEKLTISGHGVDGRGALYSDGQASNGTRFGSSSVSDESTIFLDGNASIGVGVPGHQLLIGGIQGAGNFTKRGPGTLSIEKASTFTGSFTVAEGAVVARSNVVNGNLTVSSGAVLSAIGDKAVNTPGVVFLYGAMDINARTDDNSLTTRTGQIFGPGSILASNPNASEPSSLIVDSQTGLASFTGSIQGAVSLVKSGSGTQALSGHNTYSGSTTVQAGVLQVNGTHTGGENYAVVGGGSLSGNGAVDAAVVVEAGGIVAPGASVGSLTLGEIEFQTGSTLAVELGGLSAGIEHDELAAGAATLGGSLSVSLLESDGALFLPPPDGSFTILTAESLSGSFENADAGDRIGTEGGEGSVIVSYNYVEGAVVLSEFLMTGDFNGDGQIDAADYTVWRDVRGNAVPQYTSADANGDGFVDTKDYAVWRSHFGYAGDASGASNAVPEPLSAVLAASVIAWIMGSTRSATSHQQQCG
ncbi:Extracellular serine protease precursor [Posidoniimonas corsicana]|uniref:Extracellular serine protease n=1 Tax=Posidoniimonas corsicana TaxID=1938618 RepID=A0A5C5VBL1_9BACT|nr:dockerin type I repeat-containing protein [Posidoniimonas corsicana]TWT35363.1 Extracellular serine protease precursor [Posidoniimonas corsicana]